MEMLGVNIGRLHQGGLIHGDLTPSNFLVRRSALEQHFDSIDWAKSLVSIDFGLSYTSDKAEDKAVDLYVLERALLSTFPSIIDELFYQAVLTGYRTVDTNQAIEVIAKLDDVRLRGRKRDMIG